MQDYRHQYKSRILNYANKDNLTVEALCDKYHQPVSSLQRWITGKSWPPVDVLIQIASENQTNLSYLLGMCTTNCRDDCYVVTYRFEELMKEKDMSIGFLSRKAKTNTHMIAKYIETPSIMRLNTIIVFSNIFDVSVDYFLGLTNYRTWDDYIQAFDPFHFTEPGDAVKITYHSETGECVSGNVLMHIDKQHVILPSGELRGKNDEAFKKIQVKKLVEKNDEK